MKTVRLLRSSLVVGLVATIVAVVLAYNLYETRRVTLAAAKSSARREASSAALAINQDLEHVASVVDALADELNTANPSEPELADRLEQLMDENSGLYSLGVAFAPYSFDSQRRLYAPTYVREGETVELRPLTLDRSSDYTMPEVEWYAHAMRDGSAWVEPLYEEALNTTVARYSASFEYAVPAQSESTKGVVFALVRLDVFAERVAALDVGRTGWGVVISKEGFIIVHPNRRLTWGRMNIFDFATAEGNEDLQAAAKQTTSGESGMLDMNNLTTGQSSWFAYEPIPATAWSMVVVRIKDEVAIDQEQLRQNTIWISVTAILGLTCLGIWFAVGSYRKQAKTAVLWALVVFCSVLLMSGMAAIRHITYDQPTEDPREKVEIVDQTGLRSFLNSYAALQEGRTLHYIPSGVFVRELKFAEPKELFVKGLFWQQFEQGVPDGFVPGFALPDAVDLNITEAYRRKQGIGETIGWEFEATVRQDMNLSRFPFDHETLSIRLLSKSFTGGAMLVPDLGSYSVTNPSALPGLDENLVLSGWHLSRSFFDYKFTSYSTDFGLREAASGQPTPELHFNISVKRNLVDAAVGYGIPLFVAVVMLFAIIASATKDRAESELAGFSPSAVMRICSALFFVVLLAHIQLRQTIQVHEIVFLEYIYFTVYLVLLLTSLHTFLFLLKRFNVRVVEYENSLIIKLLFWPALLGLQFLITAVFFY